MTDLPHISRPANRALSEIGITTIEQVAQIAESELAKLHGIGPKGLRILREALAKHGLTLKP